MDRRHTQIIQRAQNQIKPLHPLYIILLLLDIAMPRMDRNALDGIHIRFPSLRARSRVEMLCKRRRDKRFTFLDVGLSEEELSVQVGQVDRVEVDDLDVSKADEDEVFK